MMNGSMRILKRSDRYRSVPARLFQRSNMSSSSKETKSLDFIDPHFHFWDITPNSKTSHNATFLGDVGKRFPTYLPKDYIQDMEETGLKLRGAVFVEAIPSNPMSEVSWVITQLKNAKNTKDVNFGIVGRADLSDPDLDNLLKKYSELDQVKGIRHIINHHPTRSDLVWPLVDDYYLTSEKWKKGLNTLQKYHSRLSFDIQLNPHQLIDAVNVFKNYPKLNVIVGHLANLHLEGPQEEDNKNIETWRKGISQLATLPNVTMKLSMVDFIKKDWSKSKQSQQIIKELFIETIKLFGSNRCMFASNYPVDKMTTPPDVMYSLFRSFVSDLSEKEQTDLFYNTAKSVYRL